MGNLTEDGIAVAAAQLTDTYVRSLQGTAVPDNQADLKKFMISAFGWSTDIVRQEFSEREAIMDAGKSSAEISDAGH